MTPDPADLTRAVTMLRTLANPTRLRIVLFLLQGEAAVSRMEQELGIRQPNLSQQLAELRDAGVVASRREAKSVIYTLGAAEASALALTLQRLFVPGAPGSGAEALGAASGTPLLGGADAGLRPTVSARPRQAAAFAVVGDP